MKIRSKLFATATLVVGLALGAAAPAAAAGSPGEAQPAAVVTYAIDVKTGNVADAGTDATVYIRLLGSLGTTNYMELDGPGDDRERNRLDSYGPFFLSDLGTLSQVRVAFYRSGDSPAWYLEYVTVDPSNGPKVYFPCYCWFSNEHENKHLNAA